MGEWVIPLHAIIGEETPRPLLKPPLAVLSSSLKGKFPPKPSNAK